MTDPAATSDAYLKRPYTRALVPDEETGTYTAQLVEFPGCIAQGDSPAEAYERLEEFAKEWIADALERQLPIPEPFVTFGYSGKVALRLPRTLHKQAAQLAEMERTSLNQLIVSALAEKVGAETAKNECAMAIRELAAKPTWEISMTSHSAVFQPAPNMSIPEMRGAKSQAANAQRLSSGLPALLAGPEQ